MDFTPPYETVDSLKVRLKEMYDAVEIGNVKGIAWFVCWWGGNKMSFFENTKKPEGLGGKIMVAMMNSGHSKLADWGMSFLGLSTDAAVLDCGCGGGANLCKLLKRCPNGTVTGIDYSSVSVEKSKKLNAKTISEGRCCVLETSVAVLPFEDNKFDVVTAFETVYFWPGLVDCFREVYRVTKTGGIFLICNEATGDTDKNDKWTQLIDGMTIYRDAQLKTALREAGFTNIQIHKNKKDWLCVTGQKQEKLG
jgi:SAM-dependent methyltransferase